MNTKKWLAAAAVALGALCPASMDAQKIGLSSQFVNVVMENLRPGQTYNLRELRGIPYTVKNRGDSAVDVQLDVTVPTEKAMYEHYEPMPDPAWLEIVPARYRLGAGEVGFSDLIIRIPDDPKHLGKHYQTEVWAHTVGTGLLAAGVKSQIRFSIGKGPETLQAEASAKSMVDLNYDLWPAALSVGSAKVGAYDVKKAEKKSFKLTNRSDKDLELVFSASPWPGQSTLPPGFVRVEDLSWVKFEPREVKVEGESLKDVRLVLDVPESLKGKKVAFLVQLTLPIGTIVNTSNRVYVTVQE